jgi:hypothetical protein
MRLKPSPRKDRENKAQQKILQQLHNISHVKVVDSHQAQKKPKVEAKKEVKDPVVSNPPQNEENK